MEHEGNDADRIDQSGPRRLSLDVGNAVRDLDKWLPRDRQGVGAASSRIRPHAVP